MTQSAPNQKPVVAQVVLSLAVGGLERVVVNLARGLRAARYQPLVVCLEDRGVFADELEKAGITVYALNRRPGVDWSAIRAMARLFRENNVKIMHSHNFAAQLHGLLAAWLAGVPVKIHTRHGRDRPDDKRRTWLNRLVSWPMDIVVAVSDDTRDVAVRIEHINPRKVRRIWNGIDTDLYHPITNHQSRITSPTIGTVTRLTSVDKDPKTMLVAFRLVVNELPDARLVIVGDGPFEAEMRDTVAKLGITGSVDFLGRQMDVPSLLRTFDIFTLASVNEGLSMTLLEAMASGLPIVASDVGGNREIVNPPDCGLLVPPRDPQALAAAYLELLRNPSLRAKISAAARARAVAHFSVAAMVEQYMKLYDELLG
jgi:sugar transferase (PEP-CTERM/EpsH1 system associated)